MTMPAVMIEMGVGKPKKKGGLADEIFREMLRKKKGEGEAKAEPAGEEPADEEEVDAEDEEPAEAGDYDAKAAAAHMEEWHTAMQDGDWNTAVDAFKRLLEACAK